MITPDEMDGMLRMARVIQRYEQLINFMLMENYYLPRADVLRDGLKDSIGRLKRRIITDTLDEVGGSDMRASALLGLSKSGVSVYKYHQRNRGKNGY